MAEKKKYTTLLAHGGALIDEMRLLIDRFDPEVDTNTWVEEIVKENALGKASRSWTNEIIKRYFLPRFVDGHPKNAWKPLKVLCSGNIDPAIIRNIMYYHAARIDDFLYDFVVEELFERYYTGRMSISADDVYRFIEGASEDRFNKPWGESVKGRLSRGVVSVLRDFGILDGKSKKRIAPVYIPMEAFFYVAFLIKAEVASGDKILDHRDWRLFLLDSPAVERLFLEAHQQALLSYEAAGNLIRIGFKQNSLTEVADAIIQRKAGNTGR